MRRQISTELDRTAAAVSGLVGFGGMEESEPASGGSGLPRKDRSVDTECILVSSKHPFSAANLPQTKSRDHGCPATPWQPKIPPLLINSSDSSPHLCVCLSSVSCGLSTRICLGTEESIHLGEVWKGLGFREQHSQACSSQIGQIHIHLCVCLVAVVR